MVVLGDSLALIWQARASEISARLGELPLISSVDHVEIVASRFGHDAPLVGAAELAFTGLLADPASVSP